MAWQKASGYNVRARVESQIGRWKRVIGDGLRFHTDEAQAAEVAIAVEVLNRMLDLGFTLSFTGVVTFTHTSRVLVLDNACPGVPVQSDSQKTPS